VTDVDNALKTSKDPALLKPLTELTLVLLAPPKPFKNTTIDVDAYVSKLLAEEDNLFFCSIMASTEINAISNILKLNKIDTIVENLTESAA